MRVALGQSDSDEHLPGLAELSETLKGNVGLFFTKLDRNQVGVHHEQSEAALPPYLSP